MAESGREFPISSVLVMLGHDRYQDIDLNPVDGSMYASKRHAWTEHEGGNWTTRIDPGNGTATWLIGKRLEGGHVNRSRPETRCGWELSV